MADVTKKVSDIRMAIYGEQVREALASGIEVINDEVVITTGKQGELETVFDNLVINAGSENAEIVASRGDEVSLPIRLSKSDEQLAQTANDVNNSFDKNRGTGILSRKDVKPTITFIDDDMRNQAYDIIFNDFVKGLGIPYTFAAISDRIETGNSLTVTKAQFNEMKKHKLVEIINHTNKHLYLATLTDAEIEDEISTCEAFLKNEGIYTRSLVPPFGSVDSRVYKIAKKYVDNIFVTGLPGSLSGLNCVDGEFLNTEPIVRIDFSKPIAEIEQMVRWAKDKNAWLVISTHSAYPTDAIASPSQNFVASKLVSLINYCAEQSVEIANYTTAYERFKNIIEYRDNAGKLIVGLSSGGKSKGLSEGFYTPNPQDSFFKTNSETLPSAFPQFSVTKHYFTSAEATTYGYPSAGTLITSTTNNNVYAFQQFHRVKNPIPLQRAWDDVANVWGAWSIPSQLIKQNVDVGSLTANQSVQRTVINTSFKSGDSVVVNPNFALPTGILFSGHAVEGGYKLNIFNSLSTTVAVGINEWLFRITR